MAVWRISFALSTELVISKSFSVISSRFFNVRTILSSLLSITKTMSSCTMDCRSPSQSKFDQIVYLLLTFTKYRKDKNCWPSLTSWSSSSSNSPGHIVSSSRAISFLLGSFCIGRWSPSLLTTMAIELLLLLALLMPLRLTKLFCLSFLLDIFLLLCDMFICVMGRSILFSEFWCDALKHLRKVTASVLRVAQRDKDSFHQQSNQLLRFKPGHHDRVLQSRGILRIQKRCLVTTVNSNLTRRFNKAIIF